MFQQSFRKNKYNAKLTEYNGTKYHSHKEADYAAELDMLLRGKKIKGWERQVKVELLSYGRPICNYYVDFKIIHNDGSVEMVEVKGYVTELWRFKWKLFEAMYNELYPEIKLSVIY